MTKILKRVGRQTNCSKGVPHVEGFVSAKVATFMERTLVEREGALDRFIALVQENLATRISSAPSESQLLQARILDAKSRKFYFTLTVYRSGTVSMQFSTRTPRENIEATTELIQRFIEQATSNR